MNIGDKINLNNPFTDEIKEYEFIQIDWMTRSCVCKRGLSTFNLI